MTNTPETHEKRKFQQKRKTYRRTKWKFYKLKTAQ